MSPAASFPDATAWRCLLAAAGGTDSVCVAFSGGADSSALLHQLGVLRSRWPSLRLRAVHVDHGLHAESARWAEHCRRAGRALGIAVEVCVVDATPSSGESPEAAARTARYAAITERLADGELLVTAHHADDQAETLLLQLLRGAGPEGLAAMPRLSRLGAGWLARPLLTSTRAALAEYCRRYALPWLEDPANADPSYDRSHLRLAIMPLLVQRWPAAVQTITRAATHQASAAVLLEDLARIDLGEFAVSEHAPLPVALLRALSAPRRANALRLWLRLGGAPAPSSAQLAEMLVEMLDARVDAMPEVTWADVLVRRHAGRMFLCRRAVAPGPARLPWPDPAEPLRLHHGRLLACAADGAGVRVASLEAGDVEVRLRGGGERLRPHGDGHTRELKKLLHASGMPPWQRTALPLVYVAGELVAVPGVCVAAGHAAAPGEPGRVIRWLPDDDRHGADHG